ncbi:MAG: hypothetical protein JWM99_3677, partial [Verrucomicrobiales bacterium]|nr:hypothetical protein [Verrucomicrobiales bacterium]
MRDLVKSVSQRSGGDLLITETAHVDDMRPVWLQYVADEAESLLAEKVPLRGVCLYPILGIPEWHDQAKWTAMGLWDIVQDHTGANREVCTPMLEVLR